MTSTTTGTTADATAAPPADPKEYLRSRGWVEARYIGWQDPDGKTAYPLSKAVARQQRRDAAVPVRHLRADMIERALWVPGAMAKETFFLLPCSAAPPGLLDRLDRLGLAPDEYYPDDAPGRGRIDCLVLGPGEPGPGENVDVRWYPSDAYDLETIAHWTRTLGAAARKVVDVAELKRKAARENEIDAARRDRERRELREHEQQLVIESQRKANPLFRVKQAEERAAAVEARLTEVERQRAAEAEAKVKALERALEEKLARLEERRPDAPPP
jgi:hypothetical protein